MSAPRPTVCKKCGYRILFINGTWQHDAVERYRRGWKPDPHKAEGKK